MGDSWDRNADFCQTAPGLLTEMERMISSQLCQLVQLLLVFS